MKERLDPESRHWIFELEDNAPALARLLLEVGILQYKKSRASLPAEFDDTFDSECYLALHPAYRPAVGVS